MVQAMTSPSPVVKVAVWLSDEPEAASEAPEGAQRRRAWHGSGAGAVQPGSSMALRASARIRSADGGGAGDHRGQPRPTTASSFIPWLVSSRSLQQLDPVDRATFGAAAVPLGPHTPPAALKVARARRPARSRGAAFTLFAEQPPLAGVAWAARFAVTRGLALDACAAGAAALRTTLCVQAAGCSEGAHSGTGASSAVALAPGVSRLRALTGALPQDIGPRSAAGTIGEGGQATPGACVGGARAEQAGAALRRPSAGILEAALSLEELAAGLGRRRSDWCYPIAASEGLPRCRFAGQQRRLSDLHGPVVEGDGGRPGAALEHEAQPPIFFPIATRALGPRGQPIDRVAEPFRQGV